jgi:hypothetical protein
MESIEPIYIYIISYTYSSTNFPHRSTTGFTKLSHSFPLFPPCFHLRNSNISLCMLPQSTHGCSDPFSPFEVLTFTSTTLGEVETAPIFGQDGSRYTHVQIKSASSMWISRSRKLSIGVHASSLSCNTAPTKSMTPWSFLASYYSALQETCTSITSISVWLNSPRIKSSQYLFLGSTLFTPLIYSFHKVHCSSNFEFNSFRFPGFCNGLNTDKNATRSRKTNHESQMCICIQERQIAIVPFPSLSSEKLGWSLANRLVSSLKNVNKEKSK